MTQNASFIHKVIYISLMALLLIPLSLISQPAVIHPKDPAKSAQGGVLAQKRTTYELSQSDLGEIDPTSETMKLASLGMQGVACAILWQQANEHKMKENWNSFAAVLQQISKLQPHFINVWIFQSWNQSYNVSVEFDDYKYRYHWVKKGMEYLLQGIRYNQKDIRLLGHIGWTFGHKIGRSDEHLQFRRMFRTDDDFHNTLPINYNESTVQVRDYEGRIDNWLVSRYFFLRAQELAEKAGPNQRLGKSPVIFHSDPPMALIDYAENVEEDGYFGEPARLAWEKAHGEWINFGNRMIPYTSDGIRIRLNDYDDIEAQRKKVTQQLEEISGGIRKTIEQERLAKLTKEEREVYEKPAESLTTEQQALLQKVQEKMLIAPAEIAQRAPAEAQARAMLLFEQQEDLQRRRGIIDSYRQIVNFVFWRTRAEAEQTQTMVDARKEIFQAKDLYRGSVERNVQGGQLIPAREAYEKAFENWAAIYKKYPILLEEDPAAEDLMDDIKDYRELLGQLDQSMPDKFALQMVIDKFEPKKEGSAAGAAGTTPTPSAEDPRSATPKPPVAPEEGATDPAPMKDPPPATEPPATQPATEKDVRGEPARPPVAPEE